MVVIYVLALLKEVVISNSVSPLFQKSKGGIVVVVSNLQSRKSPYYRHISEITSQAVMEACT
jgi:hypothetical protein